MSAEMDRLNASLAALSAKVDGVLALPKPAATAAEVTAAADAVDAVNAKLDTLLVS